MADVVRRQKDLGIDIPGDGEFGKSTGHQVNYGAWWNYSFQRLAASTPDGPAPLRMLGAASRGPANVLKSSAHRRDRLLFTAAYTTHIGGLGGTRPITGRSASGRWLNGQGAIGADIAHFKAALASAMSGKAS